MTQPTPLLNLAAALIATAGFSMAQAADPAVSAPNGKLSIQSGSHGHASVDGSFTVPLSHSWGAQFDLANSRHESSSSSNIQSVGGHFFWRDPDRGLLGVAAAHLKTERSNRTRLSFQGEKFWDDFTLRGHLGQERGSTRSWRAIDVFTRASVTWYAQPDLALHVRAGRSFGRNSTGLGAEWEIGRTASTGYAVFAELNKASAHSTQSMVGLRIYFDTPKTLKSRHRTADPEPINSSFGIVCPFGYMPAGGQCYSISDGTLFVY